jgi:hypothetical protein
MHLGDDWPLTSIRVMCAPTRRVQTFHEEMAKLARNCLVGDTLIGLGPSISVFLDLHYASLC